MKGFISIKFQRIIVFIPLINCCILFLWLYNYSKIEKTTKFSFILLTSEKMSSIIKSKKL